MPAIRPTRFAKPELLTRLKPGSIVALLERFRDYLYARGVRLPEKDDSIFDVTALSLVLATPVESTPPELVERLELLDLISETQSTLNFEEEYHQIVSRCREADDSTADLAVKILLIAPEIAWREFDRQALKCLRSLVSYRAVETFPFLEITDERIAQLEKLLSPWFADHARSPYCRVHFRSEPEGVAFIIRHGDLLTRMGVLGEDGNSKSQLLRPERLDVAHYRFITREWQISGVGSHIQESYRKALGRVFHGSTSAMVYSQRYSLEPLRDGPSSLECDRSGVVQHAELKRLKFAIPSGQRVTLEHGNVFDALDSFSTSILQTVTLINATLDLKISRRRSLVPVKICPERDTITGTAGLPAVENWLAEHHFAHDPDGTALLEIA